MHLKLTFPILFTGLIAGIGCESTPAPGPDASPDVPIDMVVPMDMVTPPPDMVTPPPDMVTPPPDMVTPPPDMVTPPLDVVVPPDVPAAMPRTTPTNGSAIAVATDDSVVVAVNRTANNIAVFSLSSASGSPVLTRTALLEVADAEPWSVVLSNDNNTAYVTLRKAQRVVRITNLRGTPVLDTMRITVGSEPTGIAISPTGRKVYVTNWAEGTVSEIDTVSWSVARTINLNAALASSGMLGTVAARPGLAHPRAIVVTNNNNSDDADETVFVTEFFSQARTSGVPTGDEAFDVGRQGVVYRFNAGTGTVGGVITLAPTADTGFRDSVGSTSATTGNVTGCFPNQLYSAVLNNNRLYITAMCESPRGPTGPVLDPATNLATNTNNFKTEIHPTLYVVDAVAGTERAAERVTMTQAWQNLYDMSTPAIADNASRRMPLLPVDLAFVPSTRIGYMTAYGTDAVFRLQFNMDGTVQEVGRGIAASPQFINLSPAGTTPAVPAGRLPTGIVITNASSHALVVNANTRNVSVVQLSTQTAVAAYESAPAPSGAAAVANDGQRFFVTGLGRWSLRGQGWNSCESCHPDGLTDNVTWFFARGPRQTTSLDGSFDTMGNQRLYNWTAIFDETHDFELNTRGNSGGVGAVVHTASSPAAAGDRILFDGTTPVPAGQMPTATPQAGLSGSVASLMPGGTTMPRSVLDDWTAMDDYVKTIRPPRALTSLASADVTAGRALFIAGNCAGCHGGSGWTISRRFYTPSEAINNPMTGTLRSTNYMAAAMFPALLNPPTAAASRTAPLRLTPMDGANDQINCALRSVGTFPAMGNTGISAMGVTVREVRANMTALAQGLSGFNPPSLVGMNTGAPFFHAGNARTLEETFSDTPFRAHHVALSSNFLQVDAAVRETQVRQLVAFLLSIDDETAVVPVPTTLGYNPVLCPNTL
jgi:YVTN family beta-propeller protein